MPQGATFDVFLSYSRSDAVAAGRLVETLRARGLKVFFDRDYLTLGRICANAARPPSASARQGLGRGRSASSMSRSTGRRRRGRFR